MEPHWLSATFSHRNLVISIVSLLPLRSRKRQFTLACLLSRHPPLIISSPVWSCFYLPRPYTRHFLLFCAVSCTSRITFWDYFLPIHPHHLDQVHNTLSSRRSPGTPWADCLWRKIAAHPNTTFGCRLSPIPGWWSFTKLSRVLGLQGLLLIQDVVQKYLQLSKRLTGALNGNSVSPTCWWGMNGAVWFLTELRMVYLLASVTRLSDKRDRMTWCHNHQKN